MIVFLKSLINLFIYFTIQEDKKKFVFYSESKFYRDHFIDLINNFLNSGEKNIILITSDIEEYHFFYDKIQCIFLGNFSILMFFFKTLKCEFMIMTLTDLGSHLKRSNECQNYVYFFHALASTHEVYTSTAFKEYDIILTNGPYQEQELRLVEEKFNFPKKKIVNTGYFFLDHIKKKSNISIKEKNHILFAPSWNYNKNNLFDDYCINIINKLILNNFKVTLRPHPEHFKRSKIQLDKIKDLYSNNNSFNLDIEISNLKSLEKAALVITDNSSIVFEFLLIFQRPIIYIDYVKKVHNVSRLEIDLETIEEKLKNKFGNIIQINSLDRLPTLCNDLIKNIDENKINKINKFYHDNFSNIGFSADFATDFLLKLAANQVKDSKNS